jgi:hypothetical protein
MLYEIITVLMIVAFIFLALGVYPTSKSVDLEGNESQTPYMNKIILVATAAIIFFAVAISSVSLDYNYCFIQNTTADYTLNMTVSQATCDSYRIESLDLSYMNYGLGVVSIVLVIILLLFAGLARKEFRGRD